MPSTARRRACWSNRTKWERKLRAIRSRSGGTGLHVAANLVGGAIPDNDIQGTTLGVDYAAAAELTGNRIHGSATGVRVAARAGAVVGPVGLV